MENLQIMNAATATYGSGDGIPIILPDPEPARTVVANTSTHVDAQEGGQHSVVVPSSPTTPQHLLANNILFSAAHVLSIRNGVEDPPSRQKIFLQGPRQSGRTTLLMNLAHDIAARTPCRGGCCRNQTSSSTCTCVAVTLIIPELNVSVQETDESSAFPLWCHAVTDKKNSVDTATFYSLANEWKTSNWDERALARIQVVHAATVTPVFEYLLSVQAKPQHEQPWGAILIDDLDRLVPTNNAGPAIRETMILTQLLALLVETAQFLKHDGMHPVIAVATEPSPKPLQELLDTMWQSSPATFLSLCHQTDQGDVSTSGAKLLHHMVQQDSRVGVRSHWSVQIRSSRGEVRLVDYLVVHRGEEPCRVIWSPTEI